MKYNPINCWHLASKNYFDINAITSEPRDMQILKKSILKNGFRGFVIEERSFIEKQEWYREFLLGDRPHFYLDGSGLYRIANIDLSENEVYLERLNLPVGYMPWIFYSWQSDFPESREAIQAVLSEAIEEINKHWNPRQELELVESTRPEDGSKNIVSALRDNIDKSLIFIADITNVAKVMPGEEGGEEKWHPNANVTFEMSYAMYQKKPTQVILVKKNRKDIEEDDVPFDFSQNARIEYISMEQLKHRLSESLIDRLDQVGYVTKVG